MSCVCGGSAEALSSNFLTRGLKLVGQPLTGILMVTLAEDKEGSGWLQIGNKMTMTYVPVVTTYWLSHMAFL